MARFHYRELSVLEYRELYALCRRYARKWFIRYEMPMCDLEDTIVCAVGPAYERIACKREVRNLHAFMKVAAYRAVANELRKRKFRKNLVWIDAIPLTMPDRDETNEDDDLVEEGFFVSDGGEGAERVREDVTDRLDAGHVPKWLPLFREAMSRQGEKALEVLKALETDRRPVCAARIAGISRTTFWRCLKQIRIDFTASYRAYREHIERIIQQV